MLHGWLINFHTFNRPPVKRNIDFKNLINKWNRRVKYCIKDTEGFYDMVWTFFILSYGRTYLKENPLNYWTLYPFLCTFIIDLCCITWIRRCPYRKEMRLCEQSINSMETTNITSKFWLFQLLISPLENISSI